MPVSSKKVTPIEKYLPNLYLTVDENSEYAQVLKKIFIDNKGNSKIYLRRQGKWTCLKKYEISITDELLAQLKNLIGVENVRVY